MSSTETPDDRDPPPFDFTRWLFNVASLVAFVAVLIALAVSFAP